MNYAAALPALLPQAIAWADAQSQLVLGQGAALSEVGESLASVGVREPNRIRLGLFVRLPLPEDPLLREAAIQTGPLGSNMIGLTLGYAVLAVRGHEVDPSFAESRVPARVSLGERRFDCGVPSYVPVGNRGGWIRECAE